MSRIDNFVVDRLVRKFGFEMFEAGLEVRKKLWFLSHRDYTTEQLNSIIDEAVTKICNYYENKAISPGTINTQKAVPVTNKQDEEAQ